MAPNFRQTFVKAVINQLGKDFEEEELEAALSDCWDHGAFCALYWPEAAYDCLGESRAALAKQVIEAMLRSKIEESGIKLEKRSFNKVSRFTLRMEAKFPMSLLNVESDWLVGRRSNN